VGETKFYNAEFVCGKLKRRAVC